MQLGAQCFSGLSKRARVETNSRKVASHTAEAAHDGDWRTPVASSQHVAGEDCLIDVLRSNGLFLRARAHALEICQMPALHAGTQR